MPIPWWRAMKSHLWIVGLAALSAMLIVAAPPSGGRSFERSIKGELTFSVVEEEA